MKILVTGSNGMIGSHLVDKLLASGYEVIGLDKSSSKLQDEKYYYYEIDLADKLGLQDVIKDSKPDRIIHLAALAHSVDGKEYTWDKYNHLNIECAKNVFDVANDIPVLFISTVDVYGFTKGIVSKKTKLKPVSFYAKSKKIAEEECKKLKHYDIYRFSPVYTDTVKRDIQKRYYLKYPNIAYKIGKGTEYEVLNVKKAVSAMLDWCNNKITNDIYIIKDSNRMNTSDCIEYEKKEGRAKFVLHFPKWLVILGYKILMITGENKYTYLLNKAVYPLRTE